MKQYTQLAFILLTFLLASYFSCVGQLYTYKAFSHKEGLPASISSAIYEKEDGGILIGTSGAGVIEFDGYNFHELIASDQDNLHLVSGITVFNNLTYFTSQFKGLYSIDKKGKITQLTNIDETGEVDNLFNFKGRLYFSSRNGIYEYNVETKKYTHRLKFKISENVLIKHHFIGQNEAVIFTKEGNYIIDSTHQFLTFQKYFQSKDPILDQVKHGYCKKNVFHLFEKTLTKGWKISLKDGKAQITEANIQSTEDLSNIKFSKAVYNKAKGFYSLFTDQGTIYEERNFKLTKIIRNTRLNDISMFNVMADSNGDYWGLTHLYGILKISIQPFTSIEYIDEFMNKNIMLIHKTKDESFILSTLNFITYAGNPSKGTLKKFPILGFGATTIENDVYLASFNGLLKYNEKENNFSEVSIPYPSGKKRIQHVGYYNNEIWVNIFGVGLLKLDKNFNLIEDYTNQNEAPKIVYTSQISQNEEKIYFGTSNGIHVFNRKTNTFKKLNTQNLGSYSGLSSKDIFGTMWFTLDYGIIGISRQGEIFKLTSPKIFPSYLFYTLNTDNNGNLIIGTNKGINIIQINEKGKVINYRNYNSGTDFAGYETHMRSTFQFNNSTYVGTIEGVYQLDFDLLYNLPYPKEPSVEIDNSFDESKTNILKINFLSKNPKTQTVLYSYRLLNFNSTWSAPSTENEVSFINLPGGDYTFEVRASYNGANYSKIVSKSIKIEQPYLKNNIIVLGFILLIIFINSLFYFRSKRNESLELFYSEEFYSTQKYSELLILFGLLTHLITNELAPYISLSVDINHQLVFIVAVLMLSCLMMVLQFKKRGNEQAVRFFSISAFLLMMGFNIYGLYTSNLHPYYAFMILLINSISSIIFEKLKMTLIFAAGFLTVTISVILSSKGYHYDKYLMLIPIFISSILAVVSNLMRHNSFRHLAFISTIINRSHFIAMAMDKEGKIQYVSKNISNYINAQPIDLIHNHVNIMNAFVANEEDKSFDLVAQFKDGKQFIAPLITPTNEIAWFEWACREFSADIKVIIGQDITEKINLQNTYEIIVENAEDLIYQTDINGKFQFLNNRFTDYMQVDRELMIGQSVFDLIPKDYLEETIAFYSKQLQENKKVSYYEVPIIDAHGNTQWLGQYTSILYSISEKNKAIGFMVVARNITQKIKQDALIASQSSDIKSSINYAKRIQMNLLPSQGKFNNYFSDSFIFYKPKDIVSGDFYWCNKLGDYSIVAIGDGTGHGVPGAFMSILGINLLNSIILEKHIHDPGIILDELDEKLRLMLNEGNQQPLNDGIEMSICVFNEKDQTLSYACAGSKLMIHDGENFSVRKGDNKHIGDVRPEFKNYITHHYDLTNETTVYLFTDGYYDQFGGIQHKKYSIRRLLELLMLNVSLPLQSQLEAISTDFDTWKGDREQTDDVTLIGLRINTNEKSTDEN